MAKCDCGGTGVIQTGLCYCGESMAHETCFSHSGHCPVEVVNLCPCTLTLHAEVTRLRAIVAGYRTGITPTCPERSVALPASRCVQAPSLASR